MENKKIIILIGIIAILVVAGVIVYSWYNSQYDENLSKANGYQTIALKSINKDINQVMKETSIDRDVLKAKLPAMKNALNEAITANDNITFYLSNAKKYAKNDVEKEFIDLLLKNNEVNIKVNSYQKERLAIIEKYVKGDISFSDAGTQLIDLNNKSQIIEAESQKVNNKIVKLLAENPSFKQHLVDLGVNNFVA